MQKLNLNHIPEAPENKDFWVVGTANREGSIDSNSYKKNLSALATKNNSSSYYVDTYPENPKEGDIITFTDDTPSKEYVNGEWKDRSAGGGLPEITLLQAPLASGNITITDYLSTEDIATLEESGVAVAVVSDATIGAKTNYVAVSQHISLAGSPVSKTIAFYGPQGLRFIFKSAYTDWTVEMVPTPDQLRPIVVTEYPESSVDNMTKSQMDALGFTDAEVQRAAKGLATAIEIQGSTSTIHIVEAYYDSETWDIMVMELPTSRDNDTPVWSNPGYIRWAKDSDYGYCIEIYRAP